MILAELTGNVAARFMVEGRNQITMNDRSRSRSSEVRGFLSLFFGLFLLSISWDRIDCFPFATSFIDKYGFSVVPRENCMTIWPMLLPFLSGFLGYYERISMNWGTIRQLGQKRVRLISLFFTTVILFVPAVISMLMFEAEGKSVSSGNLAWPLANTVVFGVLLNENYSDDKLVSSKDFRTEFLVTFVCTVILELLYFPELSLWGLLFCGLLLYVAVRDLDPVYLNYLELGVESSASITTMVMKPIHHILSERKSRKIALFLLINTGYMVVEFVAGFMSNSLGLISDACHMLFDCAALAIGLYASYISRLPANNRFNYGRGRFEILSGYANAVFLILVGALIVLESFERILDPQEISTTSLLTVSIGGLVVNIVGLIFFHEEHHHAHGGLGSCSHSHSHMNSHSCADSHRHDKHEHDSCRKHENQISVTEECRESSVTVHHEHSHVEVCSESHLSNHHDCHQDHNHTNHHDLDHVHHHEHSHHHHEHDQHSHLSQVETNMPKIVSHGVSESSHRQPAEMKVHQKKHHHHHIDHNMEGIFLHVLADTMGSVGVVISTLLIEYKGWVVADPACSIFISIMIIASVIPLLRNSAEILLQRVPRAHEQDLKEAVNEIMKIQGVQYVQNLHVWSFTNTDVVGTLQLHVSTETDKISTKAKVEQILHDAGINDLTLQLEYDPQVS